MKYWNQITPENEGKWGVVEATRGQYNWAALDKIYDFARKNNIPVKAHNFVWGQQAPSWISGLSAADQRTAIENWIKAYCTRYPDTVMIDVVNEAVEGHAPAAYAKMHSPVKIGLPKYLNWPVNIVQTLNLFTTITIS